MHINYCTVDETESDTDHINSLKVHSVEIDDDLETAEALDRITKEVPQPDRIQD